jgi:dihydrofolate reductase/thymidylate synthase
MDMRKRFNIIGAINNQALIGIKEYGVYGIPWPILKGDMEFFLNITTFTQSPTQVNAIIVGYNTWTTLPTSYRKNPKRKNFVVSRSHLTNNSEFSEEYVGSFDEALKCISNIDNVYRTFVIGGSSIYDIALGHQFLDRIFVTHVYHTYPECNIIEQKIFFPLSPEQFAELETRQELKLIGKTIDTCDTNNNIKYCFKEYQITDEFTNLYPKIRRNNLVTACIRHLVPNNSEEYQYLDLIRKIIREGVERCTINGTTKSIFGYQMKFDLSLGYPIPTIKRSYPKSIFEELMWMIRGQTDARILMKKGLHIWNKYSNKVFLSKNNLPYEEGDIGPGYGFQMRYYGATYINCRTNYTGQGKDQLAECINMINSDPQSKRIIINLWNSVDIDKMALPPCSMIYHFWVDLYQSPHEKRGKLNCHLFQRSWDVMIDWNTTTAALLTYLLSHHCNLEPGLLVHSISDAHLYQEHINSGAIDKLLEREPRKYPILRFIRKHDKIEDYEYDDIVLEGYYPCPPI